MAPTAPFVPSRTQAAMAHIRRSIDRITGGICRISTTCAPDPTVYASEDNLLAQLSIARQYVHAGHEWSWEQIGPARIDRIAQSYEALATLADLWVTADQAVTSGLMGRFLEESLRLYEIACGN